MPGDEGRRREDPTHRAVPRHGAASQRFDTVAIHQARSSALAATTPAGFLHATNLEDGRLLWKRADRESTTQQNLVVADGLIFALTKNNELVLAEASREGYQELGRVDPRWISNGPSSLPSPMDACISVEWTR